MIEVRNLTKAYGALKAVDDISFSVGQGDIVGFLGPNGAGKSTTMKILTGFLASSSGTVRLAGMDILDEALAVRRRFGYLPENAPSYGDMTVREFLDFIARVRGLGGAENDDRRQRLQAVTELEDRSNQLVHTLSKGYRQRLGLCAALLHDPDILILDEPTTGLDPNQIVQIREMIRTLGKTKTVLLSTHNLAEVQAICNRVLILHHGRLVAEGPVNEICAAGERKKHVFRAAGSGKPAADVAAKLKQALKGEPVVEIEQSSETQWTLKVTTRESGPQEVILKRAVEDGWQLLELKAADASLEDVFRELTEADLEKQGVLNPNAWSNGTPEPDGTESGSGGVS